MTTKSNAAPWADEPFKLISIPSNRLDINSHASVYCASEMAHSHNCLLRGLNSILLQAPHIPTSISPTYVIQDVEDLLFYVASWVKTVEWHHHTEETCMFPEIESFSKKPGLMLGPQHQHQEFTPGLDSLLEYAKSTPPEEYRWEGQYGMKGIIESFAESLVKHLYEEIDVFLSLDHLESNGLQKCWDKAEEVAKGKGKLNMLYDVFPCVLGACDKEYEGGNNFPPLPGVMPYAIKYWFGRSHSGAWRFNPCDFWGKPVPLYFLPVDNSSKR